MPSTEPFTSVPPGRHPSRLTSPLSLVSAFVPALPPSAPLAPPLTSLLLVGKGSAPALSLPVFPGSSTSVLFLVPSCQPPDPSRDNPTPQHRIWAHLVLERKLGIRAAWGRGRKHADFLWGRHAS